MLRELARRRPIAVAIGLAALLGSPALFSGFFDDDVWHLAMLEGRAMPSRGAFGLYRFADGGPEEMRATIAHGGFFSWWCDPSTRAAFLRPLSSALTAVDHTLFAHHALPYHAHVLVWFLAFVAVVGLLYRRVMGAAVGGIATLLFAIDDGHAQTIGWIASRHAVVAALPCMLGLVAHVRWRQDGWRLGRVLGPIAFAIGLGAGETALSAIAYLLAYELIGAPGKRWKRAEAALPYVVIALAYLVMYRALGYGVRGSGVYVDPLSSPRDYALSVVPRLAAYFGDLLAGLPVELWILAPAARPLQIAAGWLGIVALWWLVKKIARARPPPETRAVQWLALGALLSLLPGAAGFVGGRLLLVPSIGIAVVIAWVLKHGLHQLRGLPRLACRWLALVHVVIAPLALVGTLLQLRHVAHATETASLAADVGPPGSHVFVVGTSDPLIAIYGPYWRWLADPRRPGSWHCLSIAPHDHLLTRTGTSSLELTVVGGRMLQSEFELVIRARNEPLAVGTEIALDGSRIRIVETALGAPTRIALVTDGSLDDDAYRVLVWRNGALERLVLPPVGESVAVPRAIGPTGL